MSGVGASSPDGPKYPNDEGSKAAPTPRPRKDFAEREKQRERRARQTWRVCPNCGRSSGGSGRKSWARHKRTCVNAGRLCQLCGKPAGPRRWWFLRDGRPVHTDCAHER